MRSCPDRRSGTKFKTNNSDYAESWNGDSADLDLGSGNLRNSFGFDSSENKNGLEIQKSSGPLLSVKWLGCAGLNRGPLPCQGSALPLSYSPIDEK